MKRRTVQTKKTPSGGGTLLKIGEVAERLGTTARTLRFYEEQGLLEPVRTEKGTRLYSSEDIERFRVVLRLADLGLPLRDVSELARARPESRTGDQASHKVYALLQQLRAEVERKRRECMAMLRDIERAEALVKECFGCERPPTAAECSTCPVSRNLARSKLFHLVWDRDGPA